MRGDSNDLLILVESNFAGYSAASYEECDDAGAEHHSAFPAVMMGMALIVAAVAIGASLAVEMALALAGTVMVVLALSRWFMKWLAHRRLAVSRLRQAAK